MQDLDRIQDKIGNFPGIDRVPSAGSVSYTVLADLPAAQVTDTTNWLDLVIEVQSAGQWIEVARLGGWQGGPGKTAPSLTYTFPVRAGDRAAQAPQRIRGRLLNGIHGTGSPAVCGLQSSFGN